MSLTVADLKNIEKVIDLKLEEKLAKYLTKDYFDEKFNQLADLVVSLHNDSEYEGELWRKRILDNSSRIDSLERHNLLRP